MYTWSIIGLIDKMIKRKQIAPIVSVSVIGLCACGFLVVRYAPRFNIKRVSTHSCWNEYKVISKESQMFDYMGSADFVVESHRVSLSHFSNLFNIGDVNVDGICMCTLIAQYQQLLGDFEDEFMRKKDFERVKRLSALKAHLEMQKNLCAHPDMRFPIALFRKSIEKLEYSLVRVMEAEGEKPLTTEEVMKLLPDALFEIDFKLCKWAVYESDYFDRVKTFRDMITLGIALNKWRREHGGYPNSLDLLYKTDDRLRVSHIEYDHQHGIWQLFCPSKWWMKNVAPFNVYIPVITRNSETDWPLVKCLWLSSDFSKKRRQLFVDGVINDDNETWRCRLVNGRIQH